MSSTTELSPFNERDFRAIEAAVLETEKGRWFLNEFGRRNRVADTQTLLGALGRLERNLTSQPATDLEEDVDIAALSSAIDATRADIGSVRNDMLKDRADIPADKDPFTHLSENAHQISVDLIATAEALQGTVNTLRNSNGDTSHADTIDGHVHNLFDGGWRQDVLAQRISKAMGLLEHLDQNLKALAGTPDNRPQAVSAHEISKILPNTLTPENLKFFEGDDDMFANGDKAAEAEPEKLSLDILKDDPRQASPQEIETVQETDGNTVASDLEDVTDAAEEPDRQPPETEVMAEPAARDTSESEPTAQETSEPDPAPEAATEAPVEPNIVIIRRGKSPTEPAALEDDSKAEDSPPAPSATEEIQVVVRSAAETDAAGPQPEISAEVPSGDPEPETSSGQIDERADEAALAGSTTGTEDTMEAATASDAIEAFADIAAEAPETPDIDKTERVDDAVNASTGIVAAPSTEENADKADESDDDKERIVVIRRSTSQEAEIPFAEYLGLEPDPGPQTKSGAGS